MSSLQRYKKSGGFLQLLSLLETFGPQKKEKFLEMIDAESPAWAQALRDKMLTVERIFSWPDAVVAEVFKELQPKNLAFVLQGLKDDQRARVNAFLSHAEQRRLSDILTESKPKPDEISSSMVKVVEQTRKMIMEKMLHPEKFDPKLLIPEAFESKLDDGSGGGGGGGGGAGAADVSPAEAAAAAALASDPRSAPTLEVAQLQRTCALLLKENKGLKAELQSLRDKLEQIRRIA